MPPPPPLLPDRQPRRGAARRDRHGRGPRGPTALPGPLTPQGTHYPPTAARRFDELVLSLVRQLQDRWDDTLESVEFEVEEIPLLPADWDPLDVPLSTVVAATPSTPARIVLYRRPIEFRAADALEMSALVLAVLVEQVAELLGRDPAEIDPRYEG